MVGMVHEMSLPRAPSSRLADGNVTAAMAAAVAVHETIPIRAALRLLASTHSREAIVVSSEGKPLGVFRDIDGMRWIAQAREESKSKLTWATEEER